MNPRPSILAPFRELAAEALRFGYDRTPVVDGVAFRAQPGELLAIVGTCPSIGASDWACCSIRLRTNSIGICG